MKIDFSQYLIVYDEWNTECVLDSKTRAQEIYSQCELSKMEEPENVELDLTKVLWVSVDFFVEFFSPVVQKFGTDSFEVTVVDCQNAELFRQNIVYAFNLLKSSVSQSEE